MEAPGIILRIPEKLVYIPVIGNIGKIQLGQHIFIDKPAHHIVRGNDHIIIGSAPYQLGIERLIAVKGSIVHPNPRAPGELRVHVQRVIGSVGDILAPVVNIYGNTPVGRLGFSCQSRQGRNHCQTQGGA